MTRRLLGIHPGSRCDAVRQIEAEASRKCGGVLELHWAVTGAIRDLLLPPAGAPVRADELWRHTCFEAFVRSQTGEDYYEFNFSPSTEWAAYRFDGYRSGMRVADEIAPPRIVIRRSDDTFEMHAVLTLPRLEEAAIWQLDLAAVIEERGGRISYWALAHPPGKPDFHHSDCFTLEFP
ncbi:MAG TPA: DOMON-like domain-containing protein [Rhizomicrobium sp.]